MKYLEARDRIQSGDLIAFSSPGVVGRAIRGFTGSQYSHVGIAWRMKAEGEERVWLVESREWRGVTMRSLRGSGDFYLLPMAKWTPAAAAFVLPKIDRTPYNYAGLVRRVVKMSPNRVDAYYCSQFAAAVLRIAGHDIALESGDDPSALVTHAQRSLDIPVHYVSAHHADTVNASEIARMGASR